MASRYDGGVNESQLTELLGFARRLAVEAGDVARNRGAMGSAHRKLDDSPVTAIDHAIQASIVDAIVERFSDHAIIAEEPLPEGLDEVAPRPDQARYCWVIDPLDGTRNLVAGFPCFATSIALLDRGEPIVGVVVEHNLRKVYAAARGHRATCDDRPMRVSSANALDDLLLGVPSSKDPLTERVVHRWLATPGVNLRNVGSAAMHLALVASGALQGTFCKQCKLWDVAAGVLLVSEAGGVTTDPSGRPLTPFDLTLETTAAPDIPSLAACATLHAHLLSTLHA